jgi:hypothetical protein
MHTALHVRLHSSSNEISPKESFSPILRMILVCPPTEVSPSCVNATLPLWWCGKEYVGGVGKSERSG